MRECTGDRRAFGYCEDHLIERRPAQWAVLQAAAPAVDGVEKPRGAGKNLRAQRERAAAARRPRDSRPGARRLKGRTEARLFTQPLRRLTRSTSLGYEIIDFARDVLGEPLLEWQAWLVIHAMELLPDGTFRFRTILALVARQNGKTHLSKVLALWRLYVDGAKLVLGSAQDLTIAREVLEAAAETARTVPELAEEFVAELKGNGKEALIAGSGRYLIRASNRKAGRGLSVDHLTMDEIREQRDWLAWSALSKTIMARSRGQIWALSNAGDSQSVVLNHLRAAAGVVEDENGDESVTVDGARDPSIGIFEWSAPKSCELDDVNGWEMSNPSLGVTMSEAAVRSALATDPPEVFRTEVLCSMVDALKSAIDTQAWQACRDPSSTLDGLRDRVVLCLDVAPDGDHVTLIAAADTPDDRVKIEPVTSWRTTAKAREELPAWIERVAPRAVAWFPGGPAAALAADIRPKIKVRSDGKVVPPKRGAVEYVEITGSGVGEACQGLADLVKARRVIHPGDPLLDGHISGAVPYKQGDGWRFVRLGVGHVDAAYAAAGAVHTVRTLPVAATAPKPQVV